MIVCSYSYPKNVLYQSAGDVLPGDLFCDKIIPECTNSVSKTSIVATFHQNHDCYLGYEIQLAWDGSGLISKATVRTYSSRKESARREENIAVVRDYTVQLNVRTRHSDSLVIPSSWLCLRTDFLGLRPTESLTAAIFSSFLALLCHS